MDSQLLYFASYTVDMDSQLLYFASYTVDMDSQLLYFAHGFRTIPFFTTHLIRSDLHQVY
jgi:hypothetical protein